MHSGRIVNYIVKSLLSDDWVSINTIRVSVGTSALNFWYVKLGNNVFQVVTVRHK